MSLPNGSAPTKKVSDLSHSATQSSHLTSSVSQVGKAVLEAIKAGAPNIDLVSAPLSQYPANTVLTLCPLTESPSQSG